MFQNSKFLTLLFSTFAFSVLLITAGSNTATTSSNLNSNQPDLYKECLSILTNKKLNQKSSSEKKLSQLSDLYWKFMMNEFPEWATYVGYPEGNDRWTDLSPESFERRKKVRKCLKDSLLQMDLKNLSGLPKTNYELLLRRISNELEESELPGHLLPISQMEGIHLNLPDYMFAAPKARVRDYEDRITRLRNLPEHIDQLIGLMKEGLQKKVTLPKFLMEKVPGQIDQITQSDLSKNPIYAGFEDLPRLFSEEEKKLIQSKAAAAIADQAIPAFNRLKKFFLEEYIPGCRSQISWREMPSGEKWYAFLSRWHTTTNLTPKEIHDLGLKEVERISKAMDKIRADLKFKGSAEDFKKFLNTDDQFYFQTSKELLREYRDIAKRIDPELYRLFKQIPHLQYGIREMPAYKAASAPTAYYQSGSVKTGRAGFFEANTFDLRSRPKFEMEALTVHEAVPGHHLQISLAQEVEGLPEFRRQTGYTAFSEGWGLYSEVLGYDLGLYKDLYSQYGQLSYDMWRAVRLVVDTGMHMLGWSKQEALDYFMKNVGKGKLQSENEIDRYIIWPGQALAYKIGQLKILELRDLARTQLKDDFDIRDFHFELLRHGALPLDVLESKIKEWLRETKETKSQQKKQTAKQL